MVATSLVFSLTSADAGTLNWLRWFGKEANQAFVDELDNEFEEQLSEHDFGLRLYELTPGWTYDYRIWPYHGDWTGEIIEGSVQIDVRGRFGAVWNDLTEYEVRYGNDQEGWTNWDDPAILFEDYAGTSLAVGVDPGVKVELRPKDMPSATVSGHFSQTFDEYSVVHLVWPQWRYQLRGRETDWRSIRTLEPRDLELMSADVQLLCLSETGCTEGETGSFAAEPPEACDFRPYR